MRYMCKSPCSGRLLRRGNTARSDALDHRASQSSLHTEAAGIFDDASSLEEHIRAMRRYAYILIGRPTEVDDIVQETLKRALTYLYDGKGIRNLRSYLFTMLHHVRNDHFRREKHYVESLPISEDMHLAVPAPQADNLYCRDVIAAMQALPDEQREVLWLVAIEGVSYQDATEILDVPIGTIMSRLNRGRNALKKRLDLSDDDLGRRKACSKTKHATRRHIAGRDQSEKLANRSKALVI